MPEFLRELWNRRLVQFAAIYLGVAWVLLQVANQLEETLELPSWVDQSVLVLIALGFPIALIVAWASGGHDPRARHGDSSPAAPESQEASEAEPPAGLPLVADRPSIAVLPFTNMSNDPDPEFLADGMTEDILTGLACNRHLFVIARNTSFT
ncbi:MAG: hypothetical protein JRG86_16600 [Deltaproteobacteria bacterium]|nr:hypothetical protein [Deltaproteobacteria bacterium]MBW2498788.1 hypothetical protein [Deltaproteobacteria bacterium]